MPLKYIPRPSTSHYTKTYKSLNPEESDNHTKNFNQLTKFRSNCKNFTLTEKYCFWAPDFPQYEDYDIVQIETERSEPKSTDADIPVLDLINLKSKATPLAKHVGLQADLPAGNLKKPPVVKELQPYYKVESKNKKSFFSSAYGIGNRSMKISDKKTYWRS